MTCKQFFKSTTFKCIAVLVCIALVSGGLLAILNDLWNVSDEERINRDIESVCGKGVQKAGDNLIGDTKYETSYGVIEAVYPLSNGAYLIKATGNEGYHSGTVSLNVLVVKNQDELIIDKASVASYAASQTLMSKFNDASLGKFVNDSSYIEGGATYSSKAVRNALNIAKEYISTTLVGLV